MTNGNAQALKAVLEWHLDSGVDEMLADAPVDRTAQTEALFPAGRGLGEGDKKSVGQNILPKEVSLPSPNPLPAKQNEVLFASNNANKSSGLASRERAFLGASEARNESIRLAKQAQTLDELREAIASFDGLALKKTATNLVFCDGHPEAPLMLVGEAPGADEDRLGKPFVGVSGQLLDHILSYIDVSRTSDDPEKAIYISNILNWRPPGNRTPSPSEVEVSLPFIERHIVLARPKMLLLAGGVSAKSLLRRSEGISKLRGSWHAWTPQTTGIAPDDFEPVPALATYHPAYLLRTPSQKRLVWADMLMILKKRRELGL